jgi:hypothetical protein
LKPEKDGLYWIKYRDPHLDGTSNPDPGHILLAAFDDGWVMFMGTEVPGCEEHVLSIGPEVLEPEDWEG